MRYKKYRAYGQFIETQKKTAETGNGAPAGNGQHALSAP
jgi:hypothetical protein